ncbi:MAG: oxygen-independent coproporphyrinogen III oxidase [Cryomorphaceae bacterium]|nr:oxygen-independent coproporphyrinogen III oxidase [Cryomorphaceae bacterium]
MNNTIEHKLQLADKYSARIPRYTSYPPVPQWNGSPLQTDWMQEIYRSTRATEPKGIALYVHLPFCEDLCTYCGCNKRITKNHAVEAPYIDTVLKEWDSYSQVLPDRFKLSELHLGGGTPTFFSAQELKRLVSKLLENAIPVGEGWSVEVHPSHTTREQLETLYELGFRRISIGVQSFNKRVQFLINRIQPFDVVKEINDMARSIGFTSVNMDILYGLPQQRVEDALADIDTIAELRPDRIAYYGYAHVPWKAAGQRRYSEADLPTTRERILSAELGREKLLNMGYHPIGMDHFALPQDALSQAFKSGNLHRNFMGYTEQHADILIGLGVSSISENKLGYRQNERVVEAYSESISKGEIPVIGGHTFTPQDADISTIISNVMCNMESALPAALSDKQWNQLRELAGDGLIELSESKVKIKDHARMFARSVCAALDPQTQIDSEVMYGQNL